MLFNIVSTGLTLVAMVSAVALPPADVATRTAILQPRVSITAAKSNGLICFDGVGGLPQTVNAGIDAIRARAAVDGNYFGITPISKNGGRCVRLTCSYNIGIWACNDADVIAITTFETLAQYAERIRDTCGPRVNHAWVHGQLFAADAPGQRWNVVIRSDPNGC